MLQVIARDGEALLVADADDPIGAVLLPDREPLILPVASIAAHGDWEPFEDILPGYAPRDLRQRIEEFRRLWS